MTRLDGVDEVVDESSLLDLAQRKLLLGHFYQVSLPILSRHFENSHRLIHTCIYTHRERENMPQQDKKNKGGEASGGGRGQAEDLAVRIFSRFGQMLHISVLIVMRELATCFLLHYYI